MEVEAGGFRTRHRSDASTQGPIAVAKENLPSVLKLETRVNGNLEQSATSEDLIFSIPNLIKTISEGITLQAGDVIATGTVRTSLLLATSTTPLTLHE